MLTLVKIIVTLLVSNLWTVSAADFIPCTMNDFDCQLASAKAYAANFAKGVPSLMIPSMDPLHIDEIENENSGIKMKFSNVEVTGLKNTEIELIQFDLGKQSLKLLLTVKTLMRGDYLLNGRILVLPIQGEGKFSIDVRKLKSDVTAQLVKKTTDDGKEYWQIATYTYQTDPQIIKYEFKNLFNGNKHLSDAAHEFANNNFRDITAELGGPLLEALHKKIIKHINKFLRKTSKDELFTN